MRRSTAGRSYLPIVQNADNFPYDTPVVDSYYKLYLAGDASPHGYLRPETVEKMPWTSSFAVSHTARTVTVLDYSNGNDSVTAFTAALQYLVNICIAQNTFRILGAQHSEPFSLLSYPRSESGQEVTIERFAAPLFGVLLRGAHMIAYVRSRALEDDCGVIQGLWIPRRAKHLFSSPGMLDTSVAGGIATGTTPLETIVKEAGEEASLSPILVQTRVRSTGVLSYMSSTDATHGWTGEEGLCCPGMIYTYDMELPADVVPKPHDDEVESYTLMSLWKVQTALLNNEFKPDAAVVVIDFLIRHGIINAENERNFVQISEQIHRRLPFRMTGR